MSDQKIKINVRLSILWHPVESLQQAEQLDFKNDSIIQLLDVLDSHQNTKPLKSAVDANQTNQSDLARLESKMDLLLLLFTRNLYKQQLNDVPNYDVSLTADGCAIKTSESLSIDQLVEIKIYFNQNCPEPLVFSGIVVESESPDILAINFRNTGTLSQSYLEKFIFRHHRNEVARIRQN